MKINIGILGLQGAIIEHQKMLEKIKDVKVYIVKRKEDLDKIQGLILPGGESTTIGKLIKDFNLKDPLIDKIKNGMIVWGTCAGMILLAKKISNDSKVHLGVMDIIVKRNAYGSQLNSFSTNIVIPEVSNKAIPVVFIRAPYIEKIGKNVEALYKINDKIVAAKQDNMIVTSFHPELTNDISFHKYFVKEIKRKIR
ncbi:pyridoxal 5'-phosphate synthase glutaminase subunit PdxT [Defluviitalea phaphyphila]|uniref:pyridoxal 5'-phosphate synthase glutaminase subunit PdxT n=1 Tax=Defluviitalea phaphyphila TaxID=1473580 RepID=UPI0007302F81|nr:pyridoxal 5'-phosphate synthase glutaminase subunit PdxT [Defluviitalea phaphyphila]